MYEQKPIVEFYTVDTATQKRAGLSDPTLYKWKNSNAVKRALKTYFKGRLSIKSKSLAVVKNMSKGDVEYALKRFNYVYNEDWKILEENNFEFSIGKI